MLKITTPLVSVNWLNNNLNSSNIIILDGTMTRVTSSNDETSSVQIPNTIFFDIKNTFSDQTGEFPNTLPSVEQFTSEAQKLGINNNSAIIVYDDKGIYSSARVWWLFKSFGFENIAVLDGGLPEWKKAKFSTEPKINRILDIGNFTANKQKDFFVFFNDILELQNNTDCLILDARSESRFNGEVDEPREGLRAGHIPNSKSLPFASLFNGNCFKSKEELKQIFNAVTSQQNRLVFSCGSGITACILALAAYYIELKDLSVYDGSWTEYGSLTT